MTMKKKGLFRDFFDEFWAFGFNREIEKEFERMRKNMERISTRIFRDMSEEEIAKLAKDPNVKVYGYSIRIGPDGKPVIREFGNVKPVIIVEGEKKELTGEREPLVDVIEGEKNITVIAEVPGVEKNDIKLTSDGKSLEIKVDTAKRKYYKKLAFEKDVDWKKRRVNYKNGILEVILPIRM